MEKKIRILVITSFLPYPLISGGRQAIFNGLSIMRDYADVFLIVKTRKSKWDRGYARKVEQLLPFVKCMPFFEPESRHALKWYLRALKHKLLSIAGIKKKDSARCVNNTRYDEFLNIPDLGKEMTDFVVSVIKRKRIDIVQVEMMSMSKIVFNLPSNVRKIFVHHELRFVRNELYLRDIGEFSGDMYKEWEKTKNEEISILNNYDDIVVLSAADSQKLHEAGVNVPIVTSLACVAASLPASDLSKPRKTLTFVGPEFHHPNYAGMLWFLENCWGRLKQIDPEYELNIIGIWSEATRNKIMDNFSSVRFLGFVDSLADALAGTTMIVPINIGSGIRMKILEASSIGVPVVSTTVGAEGLPLVDSVHAFITDNPELFVRDILMLQDENLQRKFVENSRKIVAEKYSLEALKKSREILYSNQQSL